MSRVLAEKQAALALGARRLTVRKLVFVAAPNAGTLLVDGRHLGDLIDSYTNLLNFLPANGVTEVLDAIITVARHLAVATLKGLEGLQAMLPQGHFLRWLNQPSQTTQYDYYYALAANYLPSDPGFRSWVEKHLLQQIFRRAENDGVVPADGVYDSNGSDLFPIGSHLSFGPGEGVSHGTFFTNAETRHQILRWLTS